MWSLIALIAFSIKLTWTYPKWVAVLRGMNPGLCKSGKRERSVDTHVVDSFTQLGSLTVDVTICFKSLLP